jgi:hypothetical protein
MTVSALAAAQGGGAFAQSAPAPRAPAAPVEVQSGRAVTGTIGPEDPKLTADDSSYEVYRIRAAAGQRVTAALSSTAFVPVVSVGRSVAGDCDGCSGSSADKGGTATVTKTAAEAGFMEIRVNTMQAGEAGPFTLTVTLADPGRLTPARIALEQTVQGALTPSDAATPDGAFMDAYTVNLRANRPVQIDVASTEFDPKVALWGPGDGGALVQLQEDDDGGPGANARIRFTPTRNGAYQVRAMALSEGGSGAYTVRIGAPITRPPLPAPTLLTLGAQAAGTLAENGPAIEESGEEMLVQRFRLPVVQGRVYRLAADSAAFDTHLSVGRIGEGGAWQELAANDDGGDAAGTNSRLRWRSTLTGDVLVQVRPLGTGAGAFTLKADPGPPDAPPPTARPIGVGETVTGALQDGGPRRTGEGADDQLYGLHAMTLTAGQRVTVRMTKAEGASFDPYLEIGKGDATSFAKLAEDDDGAGELNARIRFVAPEAGVYLIRATAVAANNEGGYALSVVPTPPAIVPPAPTPIAPGATLSGELSDADPITSAEQLFDRYVFEGVVGATYEIGVRSDAFDTVVGARALARVDDDYQTDDDGAGERTNSLLRYTVEHAGPQVIRVTGLGSNAKGAYTVTLTRK